MLNIGGLNEGIVIDHIQAGGAMDIYDYLNLEKFPGQVAIIKNATSNKMGRKDIIKIEGPLDIDLNVLGVLGHSMTINIISDAKTHVVLHRLNRNYHIPSSSQTESIAFIDVSTVNRNSKGNSVKRTS